MGPVTLLGERRVAGSLLVMGFAFLVAAAFLYGYEDYPAGYAWQSNTLTVGLVLTLLGLTAFQVVLTDAGDRLLGRLGTVAYLVGVVLWIVGDAIELASGRFIFELERDYVLLACLAIAAFGGAILRTGMLPPGSAESQWHWAIVWTVVYLARLGEPIPVRTNDHQTDLANLGLLTSNLAVASADHLEALRRRNAT